MFLAPTDWVAGTDIGGSTSKYSIRVRATTVGGQAVKVSKIQCAQFIDYNPSLAVNGIFNIKFNCGEPLILDGGEDVIAYFKTLDAKSFFRASFKVV